MRLIKVSGGFQRFPPPVGVSGPRFKGPASVISMTSGIGREKVTTPNQRTLTVTGNSSSPCSTSSYHTGKDCQRHWYGKYPTKQANGQPYCHRTRPFGRDSLCMGAPRLCWLFPLTRPLALGINSSYVMNDSQLPSSCMCIKVFQWHWPGKVTPKQANGLLVHCLTYWLSSFETYMN